MKTIKQSKSEKPAPISADDSSPEGQCLNYQLDFLKLEFATINEAIKRIDQTTQTIKNWTLLIWAGSISFAIGQANFRRYLWITAIPPLLFWFIDARWRGTQQRFIYRLNKIKVFLNSPKLLESFKRQRLIDFEVSDPFGTQYKDTKEFKSYIRIRKTMKFKTVEVFYGGLILLSLALGLTFIFTLSDL